MKKNSALQLFSDEYLENCKKLSPKQILVFLDDFRRLHFHSQQTQKSKSKLISIKIPEDLLESFKAKSKLENIPYQAMIKELMKEWLKI